MTSYVDRIFNRNIISLDPLVAREQSGGLFKWPEPREENYHEATNYISNSLLNVWLHNECCFWDTYYGKKVREQTQAMVTGEMIHVGLLEPETFDKRYFPIEADPGKSQQFRQTVADIAALGKNVEDLSEDEVYAIFRTHYSEKTSKKSFVERWNDEHRGFKRAVKSLLQVGDRHVISFAEYDLVKSIQLNAADNHIYRYLMSGGDIYTEKELYWATRVQQRAGLTDGGSFMCKAKIDRIKVVRDDVYLIDLKTSSIDINDWMRSARERGYIRQLAFYRKALLENFEKELEGKTIWPYIILVHIPSRRVFTVCVSPSDMDRAIEFIEEQLSEIYDSFERECTSNTRRYYKSTAGSEKLLPYAGDYYIGFDDPFDTHKSLHREDIYG